MFTIDISDNTNQVIENINAKKSQIQLAIVRALNKTVLWLKSQSVEEISEQRQIKQKLIRNRLQVIIANRNPLKALVRASLYDIKARLLGNMRQTTTGAKAGKYQFAEAFVARMPKGHRGVFKRKGRSALPIGEVTLPLLPTTSTIIKELAGTEVGKKFEKYFSHELSFILGAKV